MMQAPKNVPMTEPLPPVKLVPPMIDRGDGVQLEADAGDGAADVEPQQEHEAGQAAPAAPQMMKAAILYGAGSWPDSRTASSLLPMA